MERAGEAEAVDLGAASFLAGAAFLGAAAFLATADFLTGDFLAGEAMAGLVDLLGVRGVKSGLLFLATVSTFPPLFPPPVAKELLASCRNALAIFGVVVKVVLAGVLVGDFIGVLVAFNGEFSNFGDAINVLLGELFLRPKKISRK